MSRIRYRAEFRYLHEEPDGDGAHFCASSRFGMGMISAPISFSCAVATDFLRERRFRANAQRNCVWYSNAVGPSLLNP
jgi:hypothetical protein